MNKQIIFKLIAVIVSVYINSAQAASITVDTNSGGGIDPSWSVSLGSTFDVNILVDDVTDFAAFQFELGFDPLVLAASGIDSGTIFGADTFLINSSFNVDPVSFAETSLAFPPGLDISAPSVLATIHFQAIGAGTSTLNLKNTLLLDSAGNEIALDTENDGLITSSQAPITTAPEPSLALMLGLGLLTLIGIKRKASITSVSA